MEFRTKLKDWWIELQPQWRIVNVHDFSSLRRDPEANVSNPLDELVTLLGHGGPHGLVLIFIGLAWWLRTTSKAELGSDVLLMQFIEDFNWVLETIISTQDSDTK